MKTRKCLDCSETFTIGSGQGTKVRCRRHALKQTQKLNNTKVKKRAADIKEANTTYADGVPVSRKCVDCPTVIPLSNLNRKTLRCKPCRTKRTNTNHKEYRIITSDMRDHAKSVVKRVFGVHRPDWRRLQNQTPAQMIATIEGQR